MDILGDSNEKIIQASRKSKNSCNCDQYNMFKNLSPERKGRNQFRILIFSWVPTVKYANKNREIHDLIITNPMF